MDAETAPAAVTLGAEALFRQHATFVARFLAQLRVPRDNIEDLVQEVFLVVHRRGGFVVGAAKPTTYLAKVALNVAATRKRTERRRREEPGDLIDDAPGFLPGPERDAAAAQQLARVRAALDELELEQRALFVLFEIENESCVDIAQGLGIPVGTVYSRLHAARQAFVTAYERANGASGRGTP
jgi:RNA polymerase sigma-70 factor, ECF subfamily